jgi:hypothetical protein
MGMKVTLLDTKTGKTVEVDDDISAFQWAENNWSCDCNRVDYFDEEIQQDFINDLSEKYKSENPNISDEDLQHKLNSICYGSNRFIIIAPKLIEDSEHCYDLRETNGSYPEELLNKYFQKELV